MKSKSKTINKKKDDKKVNKPDNKNKQNIKLKPNDTTSKIASKSPESITSTDTTLTSKVDTTAPKFTDTVTGTIATSKPESITSTDTTLTSNISKGSISSSIDSTTQVNATDTYIKQIYALPNLKTNIFEYNNDSNFHTNYPYPQFSLGFHHFLHQSKNNMLPVILPYKGRKKPYSIIDCFAINIDDYENDIETEMRKYLDLNNDFKIINHDFYVMWEILLTFTLIPQTQNFTTVYLFDTGSNLQATSLHRDKFNKGKNNDIHICSVNNVDPYVQEFIKGSKGSKYFIYNNDKTKQGTLAYVDEFVKYVNSNNSSKSVDLIIAAGLQGTDHNVLEQDSFGILISELLTACKILNNGGSYVFKIYETFTNCNSKILTMCKILFQSVFINKPLTSRNHKSYKYIVCINFIKQNSSKAIKILEGLLISIETNHKGREDRNLNDIFLDYELPEEMRASIIVANTNISNEQFKCINEIISFVNAQTFRGEEYYNRKQQQIKCTKYWCDTFLPNNLTEHNVKMGNLVQSISDANVSQVIDLLKHIDY